MKRKICLAMIVKDNLGGAERRLSRSFDAMKNVKSDILVWDRSKNSTRFNDICSFCQQGNSRVIRCCNIFSWLIKIMIGRYAWVAYFDCSGTFPVIPMAARLGGAKCLWILASTVFSNIDSASAAHQKRFAMFSRYADHVDCLYPSCLEKLQRKLAGVPCTVTPMPFTDTTKLFPGPKRNLIVFMGRLIPLKHPIEALLAIESISRYLRERKYSVIIGGTGVLLPDVQNFISTHNLGDIVRAPGYINSYDVLPYAKIFLSLQDFNNYPSQSLIEAVSCGVWCIATAVGETELIVKKQFGVLVRLNVDEIANAILHSMDNAETGEYIAYEVKFAQEHFNVENAASYYEHIFSASQRPGLL